MKLPGYLTAAAITAVCWPILDHLASELFLPEIPHAIMLRAAIAVATLLLAVSAVKGWHMLLAKIPHPWFPRPFWKVAFWLRHRPRVAIIQAQPKVFAEGDMVSHCVVHLTVQRSLTALPFDAAIIFDCAELIMSFVKHGRKQEVLFRPAETGGFLSRDIAANSYDAVIIEFSALRLPVPVAEAPDFTENYQLALRGVEAVVRMTKPLRGKLPLAQWRWFYVPNNMLIGPEVSLQGFGAIQ